QIVKPGSDCQVTGYVAMGDARDCRAQICCYLTDRLGREISGSRRYSRLVSPADMGGNTWSRIDVYIPGEFPEARYVSVSVWLLQKSQWDTSLAGANVFEQNINAVAWFDDIGIYQLPRVLLKTDKVANIFAPGQKPVLKVELQSAGMLDYRADLVVQDRDKREVFRQAWVLSGVEGEVKVNEFKLNELPAGVYHTSLKIYSSNELIAIRDMAFACLAPLQVGNLEGGYDFGVMTMDDSSGNIDEVIALSKSMQAKIIKIPVWRNRESTCPSILSVNDFDKRLIDLEESRIRLVATFDRVSTDVTSNMELVGNSLLDILSQNSSAWQGEIEFILARYALQIPFWQIGSDKSDSAQWDPRVKTVADKLRDKFDKVVRNTKLNVPVEANYNVNFDDVGSSTVTMYVPTAISPETIPDYVARFRDNGLTDVWVTIESIASDLYSADDVLVDFARRLIYSVKSDCEAVFVDHPWRKQEVNAIESIEAEEKFLVFRTISDLLSGAVFLGEFELDHGVPAMIFSRSGQGMMVVWDKQYDPRSGQPPRELTLYLGENPVISDIFGNTRYMPKDKDRSVLTLTDWPEIITGIDTEIALLRASVQIEPDTLESSIFSQNTNLRFRNPFSSTIMGQVRVLLEGREQQNWQVEPLMFNYVLKPGQEFETDLRLKFPSSELSGDKVIDLGMRVDADHSYYINVSVPFVVEMKDVDVRVFARRVNNNDMMIQMIMTNNSSEQYSLLTFIYYPDMDYDEKSARLEPGTTITRTFVLKNAVRWLGRYMRVGLRDPKGDKSVNYQIKVQ
ncbi:MAG: hypothetical protein JXM68_03035, partial [Sedimentisphaerales bacterium]|nr:hypothetical protein [Sedimentisphaerales bacterium]